MLVILLGFELMAVLVANAWDQEAFRQLVVDTLISNGPMALIGLLLMLFASRLDFPAQRRSPLSWTVLVVGALLSLAMFVAVPVTVGGNRLIQAPWGTSQRANPAMTTPKSRNGIASNSNP